MAIATWWRGDPCPELRSLAGFEAGRPDDVQLVADVNGLQRAEVDRRLDEGHRVYVGSLDGAPATYGWVATREVSLGELDLRFTLPAQDRYLWDFGTLPEFRGRGLYPRLLHAIRAQEASEAERLWIVHAPENGPSAAGIERAGFQPVAELSFTADAGVALQPIGQFPRVRAAAELFGVSIAGERLMTCWRCEAGEPCGCRSSQGQPCTCHVTPGWRQGAPQA